MTADELRLLAIHRVMDGVAGLDLHLLASELAQAAHREEPGDADYLAATRTALDVLVKQEFGEAVCSEAEQSLRHALYLLSCCTACDLVGYPACHGYGRGMVYGVNITDHTDMAELVDAFLKLNPPPENPPVGEYVDAKDAAPQASPRAKR